MRKITIKNAKRRAWTALSKYVRAIESRCCTCPAYTTEAGHFKHNGDKVNKNLGGNALWYDIRNIHGQCAGCNRWKSGNLSNYAIFLEEKYGNGILQELQKLYYTPKKWTIEEVLSTAIFYEARLSELYVL